MESLLNALRDWAGIVEISLGLLLAFLGWLTRTRPWEPEDLASIAAELAKERRRIAMCPDPTPRRRTSERRTAVNDRAVTRWISADLMSPGMRVRGHLTASLWLSLTAVAMASLGSLLATWDLPSGARAVLLLSQLCMPFALIGYLRGMVKLLSGIHSPGRRRAYADALNSLLDAHGYTPDGSPHPTGRTGRRSWLWTLVSS